MFDPQIIFTNGLRDVSGIYKKLLILNYSNKVTTRLFWKCQRTPSPDFFCVWRCQRRSLRFKIFVNACYDNNYYIFFLKTVSDNVRWIQTISDNIRPYLFKSAGGNVGGILLIYENNSVCKCLRVSHVIISTNTLSVFISLLISKKAKVIKSFNKWLNL